MCANGAICVQGLSVMGGPRDCLSDVRCCERLDSCMRVRALDGAK